MFINCSVLTLVLGSCGSVQDKLLEKVLIDAGENASELQRVLDHYDDERSEVAEWLVTNMNGRYGIRGESIDSIEHVYTELPNNGIWDFDSTQLSRAKRFYELPRKIERDVSTIDSKYLISHIDDSWNLKNCMKWNKNLSTEDFRELILPYRSGDEMPTSWREAYRARYDSIAGKVSECDNSVDAARIISEAIGEAHYNNQLRSPHRTATRLLETPVGYCRDDCDRTLYAMRAFGVPVAVMNCLHPRIMESLMNGMLCMIRRTIHIGCLIITVSYQHATVCTMTTDVRERFTVVHGRSIRIDWRNTKD